MLFGACRRPRGEDGNALDAAWHQLLVFRKLLEFGRFFVDFGRGHGAFRLEQTCLAQLSDLIKLAGLFGQCDFLRPYGSSMAVLSGAKRNADTGPRLADCLGASGQRLRFKWRQVQLHPRNAVI
jgi:hypothetical protein